MMRKMFTIALVAGALAGLPSTAYAETSPAEAAARAYIEALVTHDASAVPLAEDAHRVENGIPTGCSGEDIRWQLDNGPQYRVITAVRELTVSVRGDHVDTHYLLDTGLLGIDLVTVQVTESFVVPEGLISQITATIGL
jgi:hypothetical protein